MTKRQSSKFTHPSSKKKKVPTSRSSSSVKPRRRRVVIKKFKILLRNDLSSYSKAARRQERMRLYRFRYKVKQKIASRKYRGRNQERLRHVLRQSTWLMRRWDRQVGQVVKRVGRFVDVKQKGQSKGHIVNIYKWELTKFLVETFKRRDYLVYKIGKKVFTVDHKAAILAAADDLETRADLTSEYFFVIEMNSETRTIQINFV